MEFLFSARQCVMGGMLMVVPTAALQAKEGGTREPVGLLRGAQMSLHLALEAVHFVLPHPVARSS
jgi:hypothetical protein